MRILAALTLTAAHGILVGIASRLPDAVAAVLASTVYLPLWPASTIGLPVFGLAESGGWPGPSLLGWTLLGVLWFAVWLMVASLFRRRR